MSFHSRKSRAQEEGSSSKPVEPAKEVTATTTTSSPTSVPWKDRAQQVSFPEYVVGSQPQLEQKIKDGTCVIGEMKMLKWTTGIAFGKNSEHPRNVAIQKGTEGRGYALPDDVVAIELWPQTQWKPDDPKSFIEDDGAPYQPYGLVKRNDPAQPTKLPDGREVYHVVPHSQFTPQASTLSKCGKISAALGVAPPTNWPADRQPNGTVCSVLQRGFQALQPCRFFDPQQKTQRIYDNRWYRFKPYNEAFPILAVNGNEIPVHFRDDISQYLFLLEIKCNDKADPKKQNDVEWVDDKFPLATLVCSLGKAGSVIAETKAICAMCKINDEDFSDEVEKNVMPEFEVPHADVLKEMDRRDLRDEEFVVTIDPATARDLDDALSCTRTSSGYRIGVHIADVSFFVPFGSALDEEAKARSTSVYFVERVIPMLPRKLSEDYCSLNAGNDKFAFSAIFYFDNNGRMISEWFGKSVIRNRCRMAYEEAQKIIDGDESCETLNFDATGNRKESCAKVVATIKNLHQVASMLRTMRKMNGALALNKAKMTFQFEDHNSRLAPKGFDIERTIDANWVVEEFMLLANCRVGEKVVEYLPDDALLRRHERPNQKKLKSFVDVGSKYGFNISGKTSKSISESLAKYDNHPDRDTLRVMITYCMALAKYCCSAEDEKGSVRHFALAVPIYTHFTSPIRRYCDLITHRQLSLALEIEKHVKNNKVKGNAMDQVDISKYENFKYYLHPSDVEFMAVHANERKMAARKAGDASRKLFFCLYLEALRTKSTVDPALPSVQRCRAVVTRVKSDTFNMYAPQLGVDVEIYHNSALQKWIGENEVNEDDGTFEINWGTNAGKEVKEKVGLFFETIVSLQVVNRPITELDMILHPPWERVQLTQTSVPHSL